MKIGAGHGSGLHCGMHSAVLRVARRGGLIHLLGERMSRICVTGQMPQLVADLVGQPLRVEAAGAKARHKDEQEGKADLADEATAHG